MNTVLSLLPTQYRHLPFPGQLYILHHVTWPARSQATQTFQSGGGMSTGATEDHTTSLVT